MLTIFTVPKPFIGHVGIIQRNAIQSWAQLHPECEIILFGDDDKVDKVAAEFGIRHIPHVERNEYGTPLINSAFDIAQQISTHQLMCYVNTDIILLSDFLVAVQQIHEHKGRFLLIGQRWDVDLRRVWDLTKPDWETKLRAYVTKVGRLHPPTGIDYFVFPRGQYWGIPPFAVGRPTWDNWLIYRTRFLRIPVIDATDVITVVHQNHGYEHVPQSVDGTYSGPEGNRNLELAGGYSHVFVLQDANRILTSQGFKRPKLTIARLRRQMNILLTLHPRLRSVVECIRPLMRLAKAPYRQTKKFFNIK
jgi:hypothetical protein